MARFQGGVLILVFTPSPCAAAINSGKQLLMLALTRALACEAFNERADIPRPCVSDLLSGERRPGLEPDEQVAHLIARHLVDQYNGELNVQKLAL